MLGDFRFVQIGAPARGVWHLQDAVLESPPLKWSIQELLDSEEDHYVEEKLQTGRDRLKAAPG